MPVIKAECSTAEEADVDEPFMQKLRELGACPSGLMDRVITAKASFGMCSTDTDLKANRVCTIRPIDVWLPPDNVIGFVDPDPNPSLSMADGFWVLARPRARGTYKLSVLGEFDADPQDGIPDFVQQVAYKMDVVEAQ